MADEPGNPRTDPAAPGGVKHDARGNAVWQWAANTGRQALDSTSALLKKLDVPGLKLEDDDQDKPAFRASDPQPPETKGGGYNPYGTRGEHGKAAAPVKPPSQTKPAVSARPAATAAGRLARPEAKPIPEVPPRSFLSRLFGRK